MYAYGSNVMTMKLLKKKKIDVNVLFTPKCSVYLYMCVCVKNFNGLLCLFYDFIYNIKNEEKKKRKMKSFCSFTLTNRLRKEKCYKV